MSTNGRKREPKRFSSRQEMEKWIKWILFPSVLEASKPPKSRTRNLTTVHHTGYIRSKYKDKRSPKLLFLPSAAWFGWRQIPRSARGAVGHHSKSGSSFPYFVPLCHVQNTQGIVWRTVGAFMPTNTLLLLQLSYFFPPSLMRLQPMCLFPGSRRAEPSQGLRWCHRSHQGPQISVLGDYRVYLWASCHGQDRGGWQRTGYCPVRYDQALNSCKRDLQGSSSRFFFPCVLALCWRTGLLREGEPSLEPPCERG